MSKKLQGHNSPKLTKKEQELMTALYALQQNFQLVVANMRAQVRAIALSCGVTPEKFVEMFHNTEKQEEFNAKQVELETAKMKEAAEKAAKERAVNPDNVPPQPSIEDLHDMIEGDGDRIT